MFQLSTTRTKNDLNRSMEKTLILFAHPALEKSLANQALIDSASTLEHVTINDLYEIYPDFHIDAEREKALMEEHSRVVWQHPFYWYSAPALMKEWFDVVLEYGWAYGKDGDALSGKTVKSVITTGGSKEAYCSAGHNQFTMEELLRPIAQTARLCGMNYEEPMIIYGALHLDDEGLASVVESYRNWLLHG
jgi:glutathione-regulated potassium-efflux system ancillary protein KefG